MAFVKIHTNNDKTSFNDFYFIVKFNTQEARRKQKTNLSILFTKKKEKKNNNVIVNIVKFSISLNS